MDPFKGGISGKEPTCQCRRRRRCEFNPWVRKIPWRRTWQPTPIFLPGESHGQRSLAGYGPIGLQRNRHNWSDLACMHALNVSPQSGWELSNLGPDEKRGCQDQEQLWPLQERPGSSPIPVSGGNIFFFFPSYNFSTRSPGKGGRWIVRNPTGEPGLTCTKGKENVESETEAFSFNIVVNITWEHFKNCRSKCNVC